MSYCLVSQILTFMREFKDITTAILTIFQLRLGLELAVCFPSQRYTDNGHSGIYGEADPRAGATFRHVLEA